MRAPARLLRTLGFALGLAAVPALIVTTGGSAAADGALGAPVKVPDWIRAESAADQAAVAPSLRSAKGTITVSVSLSTKPLGKTIPSGAIVDHTLPSRTRQHRQTDAVEAQQARVVREAGKLGARKLGGATKAVNVVALSVPAANVAALSKLRGVVSVKPMATYELHADPGGSGSLAQAADYVKATQVRAAGYDGAGVRVAVLDSGIDFTHANLGGPGTVEAYENCYSGPSGTAYDAAPEGSCADLFGPGAPKVKGGYDFVGEDWPNSGEARDPNPIDHEGHGTHVADIIGGRSADGSHLGIAPGVSLYAVKVCSAVAASCSGVALLEAVDWALDPNGDDDLSDAVDIVNLSLGSAYGQAEDDLSLAVDNLVRAGVVAVVSAGNSADRPFIVGSPSTAAGAISVAQTALPDDKLYSIAVETPTIAGLPGNAIRHAKLQRWAAGPTATVSGPLAQPGGELLGCTEDAFTGFPAGAVALVKRGSCAASQKAQNAQAAGASSVVIWNNVPGDPPDFSFGGGDAVIVPTYTVSLASGSVLSGAVANSPVEVIIDPSQTIALKNTVVATSSRGVAIAGKRSKPDIGAPGAWLSAEVGTGDDQTSFGGTSGAAPVVSGAAALVLDRYPDIPPGVLKARLLNGASRANKTPDANADLYATPIGRIGAGEVRVAPALRHKVIMRGVVAGSGNIGLGIPHLAEETRIARTVQLINPTGKPRVYLIKATFRDQTDRALRAVKIDAPTVVRVPADTITEFAVTFTIDPTRLEKWPFTGLAGQSGDGAALNRPEIDGHLIATATNEKLHLGWTVLPHRSAEVSAASPVTLNGGRGEVSLFNSSDVLDGTVNAFGLTGSSRRVPTPVPPAPGSPGSNVALVDLAAAGVRDDAAADVIQFAIAGYQRQVSPLYPAGYEVNVDTDRDGAADFKVFRAEALGFAASGQSIVYVRTLRTGGLSAYYYTIADFDASTAVFTVPLSALDLADGYVFDFSVVAYDNYFTGLVSDAIVDQTWTVGQPKYRLDGGRVVVPAGRSVTVPVVAEASPAASTQSGWLFLYDDAATHDFQIVPAVSAGS